MNIIEVNDLRKKYTTYSRGVGILAAIKSIFWRKKIISEAVKGVSFSIKQGEMVGFVGQNGAGKSTTLKMLSGILYPTSGNANVQGFIPWNERTTYTKHIGCVFGQKSQLWWDLPPSDSFQLCKSLYDIPTDEFDLRLDKMVKLLHVERIMTRPTRDLSLGERMKCEIIMALLHKPSVLFLDEPTIGIDSLAKEDLHSFLASVNKQEKTTMIITTHDMSDIEALCKRIIIIDDGSIIYDGSVENVKKRFVKWKTIRVEYSTILNARLLKSSLAKGKIQQKTRDFFSLEIRKDSTNVPELIKKIMNAVEVIDLSVQEPKLDYVIKEIYRKKIHKSSD